MPYEKLCIGVATKYNTTHMDEINYFVVGAYYGYILDTSYLMSHTATSDISLFARTNNVMIL